MGAIMTQVRDSSNISAIGYEDGDLYVTFLKNGDTYRYFDVPEHVFADMKRASSIGRFLENEIKGVYDYELVG